jgi:hypothetical protein
MEQERKLTICIFFLPIPKIAKTNPSYQVFFITKAREGTSKRYLTTSLQNTRYKPYHNRERILIFPRGEQISTKNPLQDGIVMIKMK